MPRGQVISGKVADYVDCIARSVGARAYVTNGLLSIVEKGKSANIFTVNESDVIGEVNKLDNALIVQIKAKSFTVGDIVEYSGKRMRIITRAINMDNLNGAWDVEITLVDDSILTAQEMEGGW